MPNQPQSRIADEHLSRPSTTSAWFDALVNETVQIEQLGVHAAMLSIRLRSSDDLLRTAARARTLFGLILRPTDRVGQTTPISFSILLAPQRDLAETVRLSNEISDALQGANIISSTGFAQRRPQESLLDTWARAEAQLDRAEYRIENPLGITLP